MDNENFQELILQHLQTLSEGQKEIRNDFTKLEACMDNFESKVDRLELRMENEVIDKIRALFDGFTLRGDQIEILQKHLDQRFDSIEIDTGYLVSRVTKLERMVK